MTAVISGPGVYEISAAEYLADPIPGGSLSSSGARKLLPPNCPARFKYELDNPPEPTEAMQLGTAAHRVMLGTGAEIAPIDAKDYKTKAAQQAKKEAIEAGKIPLLPAEHDRVAAMADALRRSHAAALFHPNTGKAEQALFWKDPGTGIIRRALIDFLRQAEADGRLIVPDYKTAAKADEESIRKAVYRYGYHLQGAWYADGVRALGLAEEVPVVLVVQETTPPYLVNAVQIDDPAMRIGRWKNAEAIGLYAECRATGVWPGYSSRIEFTGLPEWVERRALEEMNGR